MEMPKALAEVHVPLACQYSGHATCEHCQSLALLLLAAAIALLLQQLLTGVAAVGCCRLQYAAAALLLLEEEEEEMLTSCCWCDLSFCTCCYMHAMVLLRCYMAALLECQSTPTVFVLLLCCIAVLLHANAEVTGSRYGSVQCKIRLVCSGAEDSDHRPRVQAIGCKSLHCDYLSAVQ